MDKAGRFVAIGSGIKGISHLTLESVAWIKEADIVCYCVSDPATVVWLKQNAKAEQDLYSLYGDDKKRIDTYHEMVETMCNHVRQGKTVAGVFYGHPGLFCYPTHTTIERLSQEGYQAWMLPGVSAVDCLFADAGFDPAARGIQMIEATDMLLRKRPLMTESHVVVWQIGCVGDVGFRFKGYDGRNMGHLMEYLYKFYTPETEVLHYVASQFPTCDSMVNWIALKDLPGDTVTGVSTLYIPPQGKSQTDRASGLKLGILSEVADAATGQKRLVAADVVKPKPGEMSHYVPVPADNPVADFLNGVALSPQRWLEFHADPAKAVEQFDEFARLSKRERAAITARNSNLLRHMMKQPRPADLPLAATPGSPLPDDFEVRMSAYARQYVRS
jgi:precorrin-2 methylase